MLGDCHIHMVLDGILGWREAMDRHRAAPTKKRCGRCCGSTSGRG